ncbi:MAG: hypothetical protein KME14_14025 [Tildeniella torsiva UHER 1998/13D]|jgi:hypothetical protein|nr:hypothetical protein [Tildeniella torsiva UHER 1998/13D]
MDKRQNTGFSSCREEAKQREIEGFSDYSEKSPNCCFIKALCNGLQAMADKPLETIDADDPNG